MFDTETAAPTLDFPQSLADKYMPKRVGDFVGLSAIKAALAKFLEAPYPSAWLFEGASGTGKTSMALAMVEQIPADLRHVQSRDCDLAQVEDIAYHCHFMPWAGKKMHLVLIDEANEMTRPAQDAFLSKLDATAFPPNTVFVFTTNETHNLLPRFLSRCRRVKFDAQHTEAELATFLQNIWAMEHRLLADAPNFLAIAHEADGNIREALMKLELALLGLRDPEPVVVTKPAISDQTGALCRECGTDVRPRRLYCDSCYAKRNSVRRCKASTRKGAIAQCRT